ncbi:MAG: GNAT family N-acetyltransferase [Maribacter sp.]
MIKLSNSIDNIAWNEFLEKEKENQMITIAHNPSLGPILSKTFGYTSNNMLIVKDQKVVGVLPTVLVGKKMVSMPHFSYGGPIMDSNTKVEFNLESFFTDQKFEVRSFEKLSKYYTDEKISCVLKLHGSNEEQLMGIQSKLRQKIRKSLKLNYTTKTGGIELLDYFYRIYSRRMLEFGSPVLGKVFFENLLEDYKFGDVQITVIFDNEKAISAGFSLSYLGFNELCWSSTEDAYNKYNVNALLFWQMIKTSIAKGHTYYSFGRSTINSSQHRFKKLWNPIEIPIYYNLSHKVKKSIKDFQFLTKIWKHQPLRTSQYFGHKISKYVY